MRSKFIAIMTCVFLLFSSMLSLVGCTHENESEHYDEETGKMITFVDCTSCVGGRTNCFACGASGYVSCSSCFGSGSKYEYTYDYISGTYKYVYKTCYSCVGGKSACYSCVGGKKACILCSGTGRVKK